MCVCIANCQLGQSDSHPASQTCHLVWLPSERLYKNTKQNCCINWKLLMAVNRRDSLSINMASLQQKKKNCLSKLANLIILLWRNRECFYSISTPFKIGPPQNEIMNSYSWHSFRVEQHFLLPYRIPMDQLSMPAGKQSHANRYKITIFQLQQSQSKVEFQNNKINQNIVFWNWQIWNTFHLKVFTNI